MLNFERKIERTGRSDWIIGKIGDGGDFDLDKRQSSVDVTLNVIVDPTVTLGPSLPHLFFRFRICEMSMDGKC